MTDINNSFDATSRWWPVRRDSQARTAGTTVNAPAREWRRRFTWRLAATDLAIILAVCSAGALTVPGRTPQITIEVVDVAIFWMILLALYRTRSPQRIGAGSMEYKRVVDATVVTAGWTAMVIVVTGSLDARWMLIVVFPVGLAVLLLGRWLWRRWLTRQSSVSGHYLSRVVVVGRSSDIHYVIERLSNIQVPPTK